MSRRSARLRDGTAGAIGGWQRWQAPSSLSSGWSYGRGWGWAGTSRCYVSQVSSHAPASFFSAPRARGISLLVAPVAGRSSSTPLLRLYLALLAGLGLFLALRAWRGLFPVRMLALGGTLFASMWVTDFYGAQTMPNY